jgi:hypothetical protein
MTECAPFLIALTVGDAEDNAGKQPPQLRPPVSSKP